MCWHGNLDAGKSLWINMVHTKNYFETHVPFFSTLQKGYIWCFRYLVILFSICFSIRSNFSNVSFLMKTSSRVSHNRLLDCPGQPFPPVGQAKVDPWLPDRVTKRFVICLYIYVIGQPKYLVGQPQFESGNPFSKRM